jgi:peptidoglycan/LPS O-acetylase OafA/YrhL
MFLQWHDGGLHFGNFNNSELPLWHMLLVPQAWSLGIEVTFYLLAPMLCKVKSANIVILGVLLSIARFCGLLFGLNQDPWTYRFFPFELPLFLFGIILYRLRAHTQTSRQIGLVKIYILLIISYIAFPFISTRFNINRSWQLLSLIIITSLVILWGQQSTRDKKFGELSYPIYISHVLVISTYNGLAQILSRKFSAFERLNDPLVALPVSLLLVFLTSYILLILMKPIEKIRDKIRR